MVIDAGSNRNGNADDATTASKTEERRLRRLERLPRELQAPLVGRRELGADDVHFAVHVGDDDGELDGPRPFARRDESLEERADLPGCRDAAPVCERAQAQVEDVAEVAELDPQLLEQRHRGSLASVVEVRGEERAVHRSRTRGDDPAHVELEPLLRRGVEELGKGAGRERALGDGTGEDQRVGHDHSVAIMGSGQAKARAHRARPMWFGKTHLPCV